VFFSGEEPESLRGPQCELCVIDEIARMRYQQQVFDMMMMGLRLGDMLRVLIATTPRPTPFMKKLIAIDDIVVEGQRAGREGRKQSLRQQAS
jgi:phage terminase large subunit-like protein